MVFTSLELLVSSYKLALSNRLEIEAVAEPVATIYGSL